MLLAKSGRCRCRCRRQYHPLYWAYQQITCATYHIGT